jgi:crossover junction endodeoxyribonuclease RuvC
MNILGIDPGTATTGYGIISEDASGKIHHIQHGIIKTTPSLSDEKRLLIIYSELHELITTFRPATCAVEKLFFQRNVTNAIAVGQARGVVLLVFAQIGLPYAEYTPTEVKQSVTGYGAADKIQVQKMVKEILELPELPKPDDAADALAVAICHVHMTAITRLPILGSTK